MIHLRIILSCWLGVLTMISNGQDFLSEDNTWFVDRFFTDVNGNPVTHNYAYFFSSTTIIDSIEYSNLQVIALDSSEQISGTLEAGKYFRKEGDRVYYKINDEDPEYLLFDMGGNLGDTLYIGEFFEQVVITDVDSILLNSGAQRKRIQLEGHAPFVGSFNLEWIEGIGNIRSPMNSISTHSIFYNLKCFLDGNEVEYSVGDCSLTSIEQHANTQARIYPNPVSDILFIESDNLYLVDHITFVSSSGNAVLQKGGNLDNQIELSNLQSGLYFVYIQFVDGTTQVHKFIKNE